MKQMIKLVIGMLVLAGCNSTTQNSASTQEADAIYYGGDILTMEGDSANYAEAVAIKDGKIVFVGAKADAEKLKGDSTTMNDLKGKTMMPGFIDPHNHPIQAASMIMPKFATPFDWKFPWGDAKAVRGQRAFLDKLYEYEKELKDPNEFLIVWGYLEPYHGKLNKTILDSISATRPIFVWSYSAHEGYFNTAALNKYGFTAAEVKGNSQADYTNGIYREVALINVGLPKIINELMSAEKVTAGLLRNRQLVHLGGITTIGDMGTGSAGSLKRDYTLIQSVLENDSTGFRMQLTPDVKTLDMQMKDDNKVIAAVKDLPKANSKHIEFGRQVKLYADGAFFAQAMQLEAPGYKDRHKGEWMMPPQRLKELIMLWYGQGYDVHIHCNGSGAVTLILNALENAKAKYGETDSRIIFEHFGVSSATQVERMVKLGHVSVSANPYYLYTMADNYVEPLGRKEASEIIRLGTLLKNKIPFALHTDFTMAPMEPLLLAWIAANRITANGNLMGTQEKIPVYEALKAITINGAYVLRLETITGTIKAGKKADFVLLSENPMKVEPIKLKDIKVLGTVFEGKSFPLNN